MSVWRMFGGKKDVSVTSQPVLPYNGTSGWSGSQASYQRAKTADRDGTTFNRQQSTLTYLAARGPHGATWRDLSEYFGWHHGTASGVLSVLHKTNQIARLTERRNKCQVYVLPDFVLGRDVARQGRLRKPCSNCGHIEEWQ